MGQVTIYLDDETEAKMNKFIKSQQISKSKWVAELIRERISSEWPEKLIALAGAWKDLPSAEEIRADMGIDTNREPL